MIHPGMNINAMMSLRNTAWPTPFTSVLEDTEIFIKKGAKGISENFDQFVWGSKLVTLQVYQPGEHSENPSTMCSLT